MDGFLDPNPANRFKREFGDDGNWASLFKGETWNIKPFGIGNPKGDGKDKPATTQPGVAPVNTLAPPAEDAAASQRRRVMSLQPAPSKGLLG